MKHTFKITLFLIALFFAAQLVGLITINKYIEVQKAPDGKIEIHHKDIVVGPQPDIPQEEKSYTFILITLMILIGTGIIFLLIKFRMGKIWKYWFLLAIIITLSISFEVYISRYLAVIFAIILGLLRVYKPNVFVHNLTEVFIYTGITILILPFLNLFSAIALLIAISIYDMIAVWKSKHMIKLAEFQLNSKMFAGLSMNYTDTKHSKNRNEDVKISVKPSKNGGVKNAILGGGDIAFPLFFSAAVMEKLILVDGLTKLYSLGLSAITTLTAGIALSMLLFLSEKGKFYPAMPFISAGSFAGYLIILLII